MSHKAYKNIVYIKQIDSPVSNYVQLWCYVLDSHVWGSPGALCNRILWLSDSSSISF